MGYALNARRSWIGGLFAADTEDLKTMQPSDMIVKKIPNEGGGHLPKRR